MKNISTILVAELVLSLAYGCKKEDKPYVPAVRCPDLTNNIDTINLYVRGTWEWVEEKRYDRNLGDYIYITPKTPGYYKRTIILSGDTIRFFKNSLPDSVFRFKVQYLIELTRLPGDSIPGLAYYSFYSGYVMGFVPIFICKDQLIMNLQLTSSFVGDLLWRRRN